jgi:hypothetical protein
VGAGTSRGENRRKLLNAAAWSGTWPAPGSTLDLDFVNDRGWVRGVGQGRVMDAVTFTRASNGTYVGPDGQLVTHANQGALGNNLLTFPQDFDNTAWGKLNSTVVANVEIAPDNTLTADALIENTTNGSHVTRRVSFPFTDGVTYTVSCYVKRNSGIRNFRFSSDNAGIIVFSGVFDIGSGTLVSGSGQIEDTGNGWYRCSATDTAISTNTTQVNFAMLSDTNLSSYQGDGESSIFIWGAQLEVGSVATEYFPTNIGVPRFDWGSTTQLPQKNLLTFTEQFENAVWSKVNATISTDTIVAPDGALTADTLIETAVTGEHRVLGSASIIAGVTYTYSIYVAPAGRDFAAISGISTGWGAGRLTIYDLVNNSIPTLGSGVSATISDAANGFKRLTWSVEAFGTGSGASYGVSIFSALNATTVNYAGDGTSGISIWGAQLEEGTVATDYQAISYPTTSTPLAANPTCNGILVEEARTNRVLWSRDATAGTATNMMLASTASVAWDSSNGSVGTLGSELMPNGTFDTSTGWILNTGVSITGGALVFSSTAAGNGASTTITALTAGSVYRLTYTVSGYSGGTIFPRITRPGRADIQTTISGNGTFDFTFVSNFAGQTLVIFVASGNGGSATASIDNVILKQISADGVTAPDSSATAATATASGANATFTQIVSSIAGPHTFSVWLRRKTGSGNVDITCHSGGTWVTQSITSSWVRYSVTQTTTVNTITPGIRITTLNDQVEVWAPQLIPGSVLTDYQPTTTTALFGWSKSAVTVSKDQPGIDGVLLAATSITATSNNAVLIQPITLASGSRTCSVYLKRITGTGVVQVSLDGATFSTVDLSDTEWRRVVLSGTVTNPVLGIRLVASGDVIAMDYAQVEDALTVSSPILTTTAAATRIADFPEVNAINFNAVANRREMSFLAIYTRFGPNGLAGGSAQQHVFNICPPFESGLFLWNGGATTNIFFSVQTGSPTLLFPERFLLTNVAAGSYRESGSSFAFNGAVSEIGRNIALGAGGIRFENLRLTIGTNFNSTRSMSGTVKRIVIFPFAMNAEQVRTLSLLPIES